MIERGLADSLEMARALIMAARVRVDGKSAASAGQRVSLEEAIVLEAGPEYYSRGGIKLAHALDHFQLAARGLVALDVGASTGGFTHCLLQRGARKVYALDGGYGQLDYRLRQDSRVVVMERVNARYPFTLDDVADLATVDVSFISLTRVLHSVAAHLKEGGPIVALVKPQFEARRNEVGRRGVIRDPKVHARVLGRVIAWVVDNGFRFRGLVPSPITGEQGNREFFILVSTYH
jgi:23S rRNA (cytidine1920-2'-O)/16S rRNA (cytidine1409-2'-O)-methyltransferase